MAEPYKEKAELIIKKSFVDAFERLMETNEFEDITTTQIIKESGLSRTTFYRHFNDKYELATWEYSRMQGGEHRCPKTVADGDENIKNIVWFVDKHRDIFKKLFKYKGQNSFEDFYQAFCDQFIEEIAMASGKELSRREIYINRYHCMGALAILREWILSDDPLSKEEMLDIIIAESRSPAVRSLYLSK